jgi:hypothetical protein
MSAGARGTAWSQYASSVMTITAGSPCTWHLVAASTRVAAPAESANTPHHQAIRSFSSV